MIIGLSGKKQSGKNTTANILHGLVLKERGLVKDFNICDEGKLRILTDNEKGKEGWGEFDITRKDSAFVEYAEHNMWPYVKLYSFADSLKEIAVELFDIPLECVYGTDGQKNTLMPHLLWENMPGVVTYSTYENQPAVDVGDLIFHNPGPMTAREFLQFFGTEVMREIWEPVWVNKCIKDIKREGSLLAIVADVRFPNEAEAIEMAGGETWRLAREVFEDNHSSENALNDYLHTKNIANQNGSVPDLVSTVHSLFRPLQMAGVLC